MKTVRVNQSVARLSADERRALTAIKLLLEHDLVLVRDQTGGDAVIIGKDRRRVLKVPDALVIDLFGRGLLRHSVDGYRTGPEALAWFRRKTATMDSFRQQHHAIQPPLQAGSPAINTEESPLAWLQRRKGRNGRAYLEPAQFAAGERFRLLIARAGLSPRVSSNWDPSATPGSSSANPSDFADGTLAARDAVNEAMSAIGADLSGIVFDICGHLKGLETVELERSWPRGTARVFLSMGLSKLAMHFGLSNTATGYARANMRAVRAEDASGKFTPGPMSP
jgi:hypothetical protein